MSETQLVDGVEEDTSAPPTDLAWHTGFTTGSTISRAFHWTVATVGGLVAAVAVAAAAPAVWFLPVWTALALVLPALAVVDARTRKLPNVIIYPTAAALGVVTAGLLLTGAGDWAQVGIALACSAASFTFFWIVWFCSPAQGFGYGDVRLSGVLGFALGFAGPYAVFLGVLILPVIVGLAHAAGSFAVSRGTKQSIAFGPAMCVGALIAMFGPTLFATFVLGSFAPA